MRRQAPVSDEPNLLQARLETSEAEPGDFDRACADAGQERSATASTPSLQLQDTHISAERKKKTHSMCKQTACQLQDCRAPGWDLFFRISAPCQPICSIAGATSLLAPKGPRGYGRN